LSRGLLPRAATSVPGRPALTAGVMGLSWPVLLLVAAIRRDGGSSCWLQSGGAAVAGGRANQGSYWIQSRSGGGCGSMYWHQSRGIGSWWPQGGPAGGDRKSRRVTIGLPGVRYFLPDYNVGSQTHNFSFLESKNWEIIGD